MYGYQRGKKGWEELGDSGQHIYTIMYKVPQSCLTLCDPTDYSPPGSSVHGILQEEYWSELPCPSPGDLPNPGIELRSPVLQAEN